ncbi:MAG: PrsW family intramembrane metalloprotease [Deltaproteobacteria bacterium]|nr:PrsW family intramembrane metalloprotease [Deltaproteobacteria bacterium]
MDGSTLKILSSFALGFAPGVFWLWYVVRKDKLEPEPAKYVIGMYFWGMLSTIPAVLLEWPFAKLLPEFAVAVLVAPIVEELLKFLTLILAFKLFSGLRKEFDEPMDGIVYASAVALGFASLENASYLVQAMTRENLTVVFILRAVLSVPGHVLFSSIWGYALGMHKFRNRLPTKIRLTPLRGLLLAMLFHMVFNAGAQLNVVLMLIVAGGAVWGFWKLFFCNVAQALASSPHRDREED